MAIQNQEAHRTPNRTRKETFQVRAELKQQINKMKMAHCILKTAIEKH